LGGRLLVELANPLKSEGAAPPLSVFKLAHCAPQNVTRLPTTALRSPTTNVPPALPAGYAKIISEKTVEVAPVKLISPL
jgi:hypothetical protein